MGESMRRVSASGDMNLLLKRRIEQIKQRWWVVVAIAALTVTLAGVSLLTAHPTYVGKSELIVSSPGRAPDQDAVLLQGYVVLFNNPATIARLQAANHIPDGITFGAKPVAASPILTIEATADDAKTAETAAQDMAVAFRQDINAIHEAEKKQTLADLTSQLDRTQPTSKDPINPMLAPPLQEQIFNTQHDFDQRAPRPPTAGRRHHERATGCGQPGPPGCGWIATRHPCRAGSQRVVDAVVEFG